MGDVEPITLNVLSTIWGRLKRKGGSTFDRLTTNLFAEPPTSVAYDETAKKKATAFAVKVKGLFAFAPDWEYDSQDGMATVKDYQRIPAVGWTAIQQIKYLEALQRAALEDGIHLRTSSTIDALHVAPINCAPADDTWDITHTFLKADRATGYKADITNLEPVHVARASTDPVDAGLKRAVADGDLARSFRTWAHTFITKAMAVASDLLASSGKIKVDWVKLAARFSNFQATSAAAGAKGVEENKGDWPMSGFLVPSRASLRARAVLSRLRRSRKRSSKCRRRSSGLGQRRPIRTSW